MFSVRLGCWCSSDNQAARSPRSIRSFYTKRVLSFLLGQALLIMSRTPPPSTTSPLNWVAKKSLKLRIEHIYPLAEVAKAQEDLEWQCCNFAGVV
jgi:hypothetical protein